MAFRTAVGFGMALMWSVASTSIHRAQIPRIQIGTDVHGAPVKMPLVGFLGSNQTGVEMLLASGARLIDTALTYDNEGDIGRAIASSGVNRSEVFISTKVPGGLGTAGTIAAHEENLKQLGMSSVDLLLTHFPCGFGHGYPNCTGSDRQATWRGLETLYKAGKARAIGVAHYCQKHLEDILEIATVQVSVNRGEWHVGMGKDPQGLVSFCRKHGISYQSSSSLCGNCDDNKELITGPLVTSIGNSHNVSGVQVALKWVVQSGSPVTPGTSNPTHVIQDMELFDFTLSPAQMYQLDLAQVPASAEYPSVCKLG